MYRILCDSYVLYDPRLLDLLVIEPELTQKKNEPGELTFTIPKEHPHYGVLEKLKTRIKVYRDNTLIWIGRAIEDERDLYENRKVVVEGALALLLDSILRPFTMDGTAADVWEYLLSQHNAQVNANQRLGLGNCDLAGSVSITTKDYLSASQAYRLDQRINSKLEQVESLNGLATKVSSTLTGMPKNPNRATSSMADTVTKIIALQAEINNDIDRLVDLKREMVAVIKAVANTERQTLLELRYLCFKTWEQIAVEMDYTVRNVHLLHKEALKAVVVPASLH